MFVKTIIVAENQRGLLVKDGRFERILEPGRHVIWGQAQRNHVELYDATGLFASPWADVLEKRHSQVVKDYLEFVHVPEGEVAIVSLDGRPSHILKSGQTAAFWKVLQKVEVTRVNVTATPKLTKSELIAFEKASFYKNESVVSVPRTGGLEPIATVNVEEAERAIVLFDGELVETLGPGRYGYWQVGQIVRYRTFDTRPLPLEVTAQEILTKDRVSLRVTLTSFVQVLDVEKAALSTPNYSDHVYKLVQFAVREAIAGRTLDEVLNDRVRVDEQIVTHVRRELGDIGVAVTELGIKDVILPGEMRELINRVVEAEKTAQANVIRRREETAATRSLLNTAKLMENNPTLMRLKELEALEKVTENIGNIDVHATSGEGLNAVLNKLVSLS